MPSAPEKLSGSTTTVSVVGATGFIGSSVVTTLRELNIDVKAIPAPRIEWAVKRPTIHRLASPPLPAETVRGLAAQFIGSQAVINAAGIAQANAPASAALFGANALLPSVIAEAAAIAAVSRLIHVSSIAVQGNRHLDETLDMAPFSPYSLSRAMGEILLLKEPRLETVVFRPTSVHGPNRSVTRSLTRIARSRAAAVAGDGSAPTPQVLVEEVAEAIAYLCSTSDGPPPIVLQPHNGMTTGLLLRLLGGKDPRYLPASPTCLASRATLAGTRLSARAHGHARRLDMLLLGRRQARGWLSERNIASSLVPSAWEELAKEIVASHHPAARHSRH